MSGASVTLLKGDDAVVLREAVRVLVDDLVGDDDRSLVVEEVEVGATAADDDARDPLVALVDAAQTPRSEEPTSELQSLMRISYAVFCLKKKNHNTNIETTMQTHDTNKSY